jgi:hypothetical protein
MIPQHVVALDALPLTPAGKIDRKALPAPDAAGAAAESRPPSTPNELLLARVWAEALGHDRIGAGDNFFDLGGHSLLSMIVIARLRSEIGASVSARDLLGLSLEEIAKKLPPQGGQTPTGAPIPRAPLAAGADGALTATASFGQRRLYYLDQLDPNSGSVARSIRSSSRRPSPRSPRATPSSARRSGSRTTGSSR